MKNKTIDLHNHLFAQLERLSDESITGDALAMEIKKANAMAGVAREIISNTNIALKGKRYVYDDVIESLPEQLEEKAIN